MDSATQQLMVSNNINYFLFQYFIISYLAPGSFQDKTVIFYNFDRNRYIFGEKNDLPLKKPCFRVSEKNRFFNAGISNFAFPSVVTWVPP